MDFFIDNLITLWSELVSLLLDMRMVKVELELVNHNILVDTSHVHVGPGKAVMVMLEELDECRAKVKYESSANMNLVIWKVWIDRDIIQFVYA